MWPRYAIGGAKMAEEMPPRPEPLRVIFDPIPGEMRYLNQWILWRYEWVEGKDGKPGKWDKPPYQPNGKHASSTAAFTWSTFKIVKEAYEHGLNLPVDDPLHFDGVGFVPAKVAQADNNLQFGDLDKCRDKETGQLSRVAEEDLDLINSYCEISPSGTGIRFIAKGHPPYPQGQDGSKKGYVELYQGRHYLTITGHRLEGFPATIEKRPEELNTFYEKHFGEPEPGPEDAPGAGTGTKLTDDEIICLASEAKNSKKFMALMDGNINDYPSNSEADQAFCNLVAFYTTNEEQIDRVFRRSKLYREKWERADYRERTIRKAINSSREHYKGTRTKAEEPRKDRSVLENLSEKIKEDPGVIYEPEYFQVLKEIYISNPQEWARVKKIFRDRRITVRDFVNAIKEDEDDTPIIQTPFIALKDGKIAEMVANNGIAKYAVYDPITKTIEYVPEVMQDGVRYIPPTEDEIFKKGYVILPSEAEEYGTVLALYQEIKAFMHRYLEVSPDYESIASFYPMLSWVHDVMAVIAYLRAKGDWGTGKSRFLDIFRALCYRAISTTGAMSEAPIFRIMDKWKGTLIMDEGDFGKSRDSTASMEKILVCGFERGKPIIRCNPNDPEDINVFDPFGPKIIATRYGFRDKALESRCFTEIMRESTRTDVPVQLPYEFEEESRHLRNKLLMYRFRNRELVKNASEQGKIEVDLSELPKRIQQAARPLSIILANYPELLVTLKEFLDAKSKALVIEASETTEGHLVKTIEGIPRIVDDSKTITWDTSYRDLTKLIKTSSGNYKLTMQQVISKANSLGFKTDKKMIAGDQKRRITCEVPLFERLKRRYIPEVEKPPSQESTACGARVDDLDEVDAEEGHPHKKRAQSTEEIDPSVSRILTSGGVVACPPCPPCPPRPPVGLQIAVSRKAIFNGMDESVGMSKIDRPTPAHKENPGFEKFKAGMAKRHCLVCERNFSYDLGIHYKDGCICQVCQSGRGPEETAKSNPQDTLG